MRSAFVIAAAGLPTAATASVIMSSSTLETSGATSSCGAADPASEVSGTSAARADIAPCSGERSRLMHSAARIRPSWSR